MAQKKQINARVPHEVHDALAERASLLQETEGGYLLLIAQWWFAQGQPPVTAREEAVLQRTHTGARKDLP